MDLPEQCLHKCRRAQAAEVQNWCMGQLSKLTLQGRENDARALTQEHLETLIKIDVSTIMWMQIKKACWKALFDHDPMTRILIALIHKYFIQH